MWLLNAETRELEFFNSELDVPGRWYAILSHTWGQNEVMFGDVEAQQTQRREGYLKVDFACRQALKDGISYIWIDTCCIDKRSDAELSEAINSMFKYYQDARICYVYLADVDTIDQLDECRWFQRGWTLQELIAPNHTKFYNQQWRYLGSKCRWKQFKGSEDTFDLVPILSRVSQIDRDILRDPSKLDTASVAQRMSWASRRTTSRQEDEAYCLLGIFDVSMPLLYGEGQRAFQRLQEEIIRQTSYIDHSILAWTPWDFFGTPHDDIPYPAILSPSPYGFRFSGNIISWNSPRLETFDLGYNGLKIEAPVADSIHDDGPRKARHVELLLNCRYADQPMSQITLLLYHRPGVTSLYEEGAGNNSEELGTFDRMYKAKEGRFRSIARYNRSQLGRRQLISIARQPHVWPACRGRIHLAVLSAYMISVDRSRCQWDPETSILTLQRVREAGMPRPATSTETLGGVFFLNALDIRVNSKGRLGVELEMSKTSPTVRMRPCARWRETVRKEQPWTVIQSSGTYYFELDGWPGLEVRSRYVTIAEDVLCGLECRLLNVP